MPTIDYTDYEALTVAELKDMADQLGVDIPHDARKAEIIDALKVAAQKEETLETVLEEVPTPTATDTLVGTFTISTQEDRILLPAHQLINDDQVRFALGSGQTDALPTPLVEDSYYFVVGARGNDFQVSGTQGGPVVIIEDRGSGTNEVWKQATDPAGTQEQQMSRTVTHEIANAHFAKIKLSV